MKKILCLLALLLGLTLSCHAYSEENTIYSVSNDGKIIKMTDGSVYKIWDYDAITSMLWLPSSDVIITDDKIINTDEDESVEYQYQIR